MQQATDLIGGLAGERKRWTEDSAKFDATKTALVGDVAVGCAFVSYCGPFNQEFRDYIVEKKLTADLRKKDVPCSPSLDVISLLVDVSETSDWALAGLPGDPLSIQNGIVVTRSSRYPLLIDPQGQAIKWIRQHEAERLHLAIELRHHLNLLSTCDQVREGHAGHTRHLDVVDDAHELLEQPLRQVGVLEAIDGEAAARVFVGSL